LTAAKQMMLAEVGDGALMALDCASIFDQQRDVIKCFRLATMALVVRMVRRFLDEGYGTTEGRSDVDGTEL
jgi:hypothetical protein